MLRFISAVILVLLLPMLLLSQSITGKLVDQNGKGLTGLQLKLYISPKAYDAVSSVDGSFVFNNITDVQNEELPSGYSVTENYPNPFNPKTRIGITLPSSSNVRIEVYNLLGQRVREEFEKNLGGGTSYFDLELNGLPNGLYIARINIGDRYSVTRKLMLMYGSQHLSSASVIPTFQLKRSSLATKIDSLVITGSNFDKKVFGSLPSIVGNSLNLGNLTITIPAPQIPTLDYPSDTALDISTSPLIKWNSSNNALSYSLLVSTRSDFINIVLNPTGIVATSYQVSGLSNSIKYYWKVRASNNYGNSAYSNSWSFTTVGIQPTVPSLVSPLDNAIDISATPTLSWLISPTATSYALQVSTNNSFSDLVYNQSNITNLTQTISGLNYLTKYYWRVNAKNNYGTSNWSTTREFTTFNIPPNVPTLSSPLDGANEVPLSTTLFWNLSSNATSYNLQVSLDKEFATTIEDIGGISNTNYQISGLRYFKKYYWRVRARKSNSYSEWSTIWSFYAIGTKPNVPILLTPANNPSTSLPNSITFSWSADSTATSFSLQVSKYSNFGINTFDKSELTQTSQLVSNLSDGTTYYWRVSASNKFGTSIWTTPWSFGTASLIRATTLSAPTNGAADISLSPILYWNNNSTATSYTISIIKDSREIFNQSGILNTNFQLTGLDYSTKYYWRIKAINSSSSIWSDQWGFTTISEPCEDLPKLSYAGKTYNTVKIGNQCWLKENLDIGAMIGGDRDQTSNGIIEKYCYDDEPYRCENYGGLYQWNEAVKYVKGTPSKVQGICPDGWHIPNETELSRLISFVNNDNTSLLSIGQGSGSNLSGFSALFTGQRNETWDYFTNQDNSFNMWTATESASQSLVLTLTNTISLKYNSKARGYSVRCVKD